MCRSVPQIEAAFTRTSASVGPIAGTATVSICKPRAGCIFRNAFIVAAILAPCAFPLSWFVLPCGARLLRRAFLLLHWPARHLLRPSANAQVLDASTPFLLFPSL